MTRLRALVCAACVLCVASGATAAEARQDTRTRARAGKVDPIAGVIVKGLGKELAERVAGHAMGAVLDQVGLGDPSAAQLGAIRKQLDQIQRQLTALQGSVDAVRSGQLEEACQKKLTDGGAIVSKINGAYERLRGLAYITNAGVRKQEAKLLENYINDELNSDQETLRDIVSGNGSSLGMVTVCGKSFEDSTKPFITRPGQERIHALINYYVDQEALLLALRVNMWTAKTFTTEYIAGRIAASDAYITGAHSPLKQLKPLPPLNTFIDTRTGRAWDSRGHITSWAEVTRIWGPDLGRISNNDRNDYALTSFPVVQALISGWSGVDSFNWLQTRASVATGTTTATTCYWTSTSVTFAPGATGIYPVSLTGGTIGPVFTTTPQRCLLLLAQPAGHASGQPYSYLS